MAQPLVGSGYDAFIGTRQNPGQTQTEFYNKETNQGYSSASDLLRAVQPYAGNQVVNEGNVFNVLSQGYTPQAQALGQIKNDLNTFQQDTFNSGNEPGKRAASSLGDQIGSEQGNYDTYFKEYNDLKTKLQGLQNPNYQDTYNQIRQTSGIIGTENDFANNQKSIRELPYVNRQNFGNAGVATEGQLGADTQQKGIPLEIQQANLLDRLKLAQDFVNNSLKFKEMDSNAARQSLSDGLQTALQTIDLSRAHLKDLQEQQSAQKAQQEKAQKFAFDNRIGKAFYEVGGTVYRSSDGQPATSPGDYISMGGKGDFSDVQKVEAAKFNKDNIIGSEASGYYAIDPITGAKTEILAPSNKDKYQAITNPVTGEQAVFDPKTGKFTNVAGGGSPTNASQQPFFGLPPKVYDKAAAISGQFDNEAVVKNFNIINEAKQFVDNMSNDTSSPTDDQGLLYSFAKAMDPNSVVREGEYATVQKYSQSWIQSFGFNAARVLDNNAFLTPDARAKLKATIQGKYEASQGNYQNVFDEYARRIDQTAGKTGIGQQILTNYGKAYNNSALDSLWNGLSGGTNSTSPPLDLNKAKSSGGLTFNQVGSGTNNALSKNTGANTALLAAATTKYPQGATGGQCGVFVRNIANSFGLDYPKLGDYLSTKTAAVKKYGVPLSQAGVGSILVQNDDPKAGHVSWIIGQNDQGYIVAESNYGNNEKITYGRVVPYNSKHIVGVINPNLKTKTV